MKMFTLLPITKKSLGKTRLIYQMYWVMTSIQVCWQQGVSAPLTVTLPQNPAPFRNRIPA
ncbi:TPA: hypothetical protein ACQD71_003283 [Yersinia enterocolitica]